MPLLNGVQTQVRIWSAYSRLNAVDPTERSRAVAALCAIGPAALPCLRFASGPLRPPRIQYAAAVALHRLGDPAGLEILQNALRWQLSAQPELQYELKWAYFSIGAPDAATALIAIFPMLPLRNPVVLQFVVTIWAGLRDARGLEILAGPTWPAPELFLQSIADYGEMAIPHLERMAADPVSGRRLLAIRALWQIPCEESFTILRRLLYDSDPAVRKEAPVALAMVNPAAAPRAIATAIMDGYSTREAVEILNQDAPRVYEPLLALIERWQPGQTDPAHDTREAVLAALPWLANSPIPDQRLIPALGALLERHPDPAMTAVILHILAVCLRSDDRQAHRLHAILSVHVTHIDREVRQEAGNALASLGDPHGRELNQWLADCWPQGSLLGRLHAILRGGPDAGQAASHAVQQVSQWFTRLSREAADRLSTGLNPLLGPQSPVYDERLPQALRQLLRYALAALQKSTDNAEMEELLSLATAAIRCCERLSPADTATAYEELLLALYTVKYGIPETGPMATTRGEVGEVVRVAAASLLLEIYGADSFGLFLCALYAPEPEVHTTAILALGRLGDARALPHLKAITVDVNRPEAMTAHEAINTIRRINPDVMVLLRGSQKADTRADTLLRPASGNIDSSDPDILLRPTAQTQPDFAQQPKPNVAGGASNSLTA